jgi:hypothetical protein
MPKDRDDEVVGTTNEAGPGASPLAAAVTAAELNKRLAEIEAKLYEQDHRWAGIAMNAYHAFTRTPKGDARRTAALRAIFWRTFAPVNAVTIGLGVASVLGILIALQANHLISIQNRKSISRRCCSRLNGARA